MQDFNDKELVGMFRNGGNPSYAFNLIVRRYQERVYWHIRKMVLSHEDADDLVQDVFVKAWKGLENFREDSQLFTWLYRIATNETLTFLKRRQKKQTTPLEDIEHQLSNTLESDHYFNGDAIQLKLQKALLTLPEKQRLVFNMRYFDELKYDEISEIVGTSVGALKASYHYAVQKVEKYLEEN